MSGKLVCASGYFDPLHMGHIEYLKLAKRLYGENSILTVIVNNDEQAKAKYGGPVMSDIDRASIIKELRFVDEVVISIDDGPGVIRTLEKIFPDAFVKGGDRRIDEIPEAEWCKVRGIELVDGLGEKIRSSSEYRQWQK